MVLTPVKSSPQRTKEFNAVPLDRFDRTVWGNRASL